MDTSRGALYGGRMTAAELHLHANDVRSYAPMRYGAYLCLADGSPTQADLPVPALIQRVGLSNEFDASGGDPTHSVAFLRHIDTTPADIADEALERTQAIVHVASPTEATVSEFCAEMARLLPNRVLSGVVRPLIFTGTAMFNYSYAHRVLQQPGTTMPHIFFVPLRKTAGWWTKSWMERHTYFLPRYDEHGRMLSEGHARAAEAGIPSLLRRTYRNVSEPAPEGEYDFLTYFECANRDIRIFHDVCAALRDRARNPEWQFVHEGPTWHGRRVATWAELFT